MVVSITEDFTILWRNRDGEIETEKFCMSITMDYLRMDGKQYSSKVRNKALEDFDWLSQWLE